VIADLLRSGRAAALWLAGPVDRLWRQSRGRSAQPPLWLRRHTGPLRDFARSAAATAELIDALGLLGADGRVLDAGCGAGAMVPEISRRLGEAGRYVGFDVHAPSIRWCRRQYASDPRLRFELAAVASAYGSARGRPASGYRFPIEDGGATLVLAKSLFTHLGREEAAHYLCEVRRALSPGSPALVTAFLFGETGAQAPLVRREFPFEDEGGRVRYRSRMRPTAAVAYARSEFEGLVERAGLRVQWLRPGYYPGTSPVTGQDTLLLGH
jgi:SAM-dependent methyltransferase